MSTTGSPLLARLRYHVTGAIERGEAKPVVCQPYPVESAGMEYGTLYFVPYQGWQRAGATPLCCLVTDTYSMGWSMSPQCRADKRLWRMSDGTLQCLSR